jgi:hypothetical protein
MAFLKRLGYYMIGLTIGILFLTLFLKKKTSETGTSFCYFPNCRVLKELRSKPFEYSDTISQLVSKKQLDSAEIALFFREGDVNFKESDTKATPCTSYLIEYEVKGKEASLQVYNCEALVRIEQIHIK